MKSDIFVEMGPGMRFVAPRRSRKASRLIQRRRPTTSCSIMATCTAGPPNAVNPSFRKSPASSFSRARVAGIAEIIGEPAPDKMAG